MTPARLSSLAIVLTIPISLLALIGGWLNIAVLNPFLPGQAMQPGVAILTLLMGLGLWLTPATVPSRRTLPALACGVAVTLVSLYFLRIPDELSNFVSTTKLTLLVLGIALLCLQITRTPILTLGSLSVFAVVIPLYHLAERSLQFIGHHDLPVSAMSTDTALVLCLLAGPGLFLHPRLPFGQQLFAATPHGRLMLTIMPWGTLAPVLLAIAIHYTTSRSIQHLELTIVAALALFSALVTALLWHGYQKLCSADLAMCEREDLTNSVMNSLSSSIAVLDTQGKIVRVNDAWHKFAGSNGGNALLQGGIGLDYFETCRVAGSDPLATRALTGLDAVLRNELPYFSLEYPCHAPHEQRWFMMQARPLVGAVPGLVVSHLDITPRKLAELDLAAHKDHLEQMVARRTHELENARVQAELILDSTADGIFGLDMQGRIIFINPAACTMLGYTEAALIGRLAHRTFHHSHANGHPFPAADCSILDAVRDGHTAHVDNEVFWRADNTALPVAYATQPMFVEERAVGAVVSFHDISAQRATEQAHEALLTEARRLAQAKSDFLANMSHEIRTPLNAVLGLARIGARESIGRKVGQTCQQITDAGQHLLGVINDILDFSKIEAGKLRIESRPFRLAAIIDAALGFVAESAQTRQIDLSFRPADALPAWVVGDPLRLQQILVNLLSNAVKFTRQGQVTLAVTHDATASLMHFQVSDSGIGMNAEQLSRLFNAFEQADSSTTREYGGTGLGLAISQRLAHLMGGAIEVSSQPGTGTTFTLTLPLPASSPGFEPATLSTSSTRRLAGLRLLAADDIEVNRLILDDLLRHEGAQIVFATDGQQVLAQLDEHGSSAFDAVLMDVQMPVMDGYAATQAIRAMAPNLPVIGLTAHALADEREKCLAAGMVEHVTKPIDPDSLVAAILRHAQPPASPPPAPSTAPLAVPPAPTFAAPQIDWPALRARFNYKDEFLRKLAISVQDSHSTSGSKLAAAAAQQDFTTLASIAHSLKGTGGNLFAQPLFDLARITETTAREKRPEALVLANRLARLLETFLTELAAGIEIYEGKR